MARSITTRGLIEAVRSLIDEANEAEIDDVLDILPSINRGLDDAADILSRKYPDSLVKHIDIPLSEGVNGEYDIPEDAFQERLEKVETKLNGYYHEIKRIDYRDITLYDTPQPVATPYYYAVIGQKFKLVPPPTAVESLRVWYIPEVGPLVPEFGRITHINQDNPDTPYIRLTNMQDVDQLSTDIDSLEAFVNIVDGRSGKIKATMQIASVVNSKITFVTDISKLVESGRASVEGRTIASALPEDIAVDDYICPVEGTCIPPMRSPLTNFLITYASAEIKALKLEGDPGVVLQQLARFEERIEKTWSRREQSLRVGKSSRVWSPRGRSLWNRGQT